MIEDERQMLARHNAEIVSLVKQTDDMRITLNAIKSGVDRLVASSEAEDEMTNRQRNLCDRRFTEIGSRLVSVEAKTAQINTFLWVLTASVFAAFGALGVKLLGLWPL